MYVSKYVIAMYVCIYVYMYCRWPMYDWANKLIDYSKHAWAKVWDCF